MQPDVAGQRHDLIETRLQGPVAGVEHMQLSVGEVAEVRAGGTLGHVPVVRPPDDQCGWLMLPEVGLLLRKPAQRRGLVLEEAEDAPAPLR